jgi:hypothetical protein
MRSFRIELIIRFIIFIHFLDKKYAKIKTERMLLLV